MKKIGVLANCRKPDAPAVLERLAAKADALGIQLVSCDEASRTCTHIAGVEEKAFAGDLDMVIALGGDGTLLRAVRILGDNPVPVLGVNIGGLGFMTSVPADGIEKALEQIVAGGFDLSARTLIECVVRRDANELSRHHALNDIAVGWGETSRVVTIALKVRDELVTTFMCDGLIVSTPTGSTGHSLSAGGPIIYPNAGVLVINPICPHTLSNRPLVIPDSLDIELTILESAKRLLMSVDGQEHAHLLQNDTITITRSPRSARLVLVPGYSYFDLLRRKLHWRGSSL